jgi:glycosyltransferase involved in cell wall biosynthesis
MLDDTNMNVNSQRPRVVNVVNSSLALGFLQGQLEYLQDRGFDVTVLSPERRKGEWEVARPQGVSMIEVPLEREISPVRDFASLWRLWRIMRALCPVITNVGTPKGGFLGGFASWLNRVPCRFYTLRGLRFETTTGLRRRLLICAERLACGFAHRVICVSKSVQEKAIASGLTSRARTVVFGSGSSNGVDASRFMLTPEVLKRADVRRYELGIPPKAPVVGFVGRLARDKGIPELTEAFLQLSDQFPDLRLLLVGRFENGDPVAPETRRCLESHPRVILAGHYKASPNAEHRVQRPVEDTPPYYALMDLLILPSHREGLPNVVLEAQAAGKPVAAAMATGIVDAVIDGETGLLFPVGDVSAIVKVVTRLLNDKELADKLGRAGQARVMREFRQEQVWEALFQEYLRVFKTTHLPFPQQRIAGRDAADLQRDRVSSQAPQGSSCC